MTLKEEINKLLQPSKPWGKGGISIYDLDEVSDQLLSLLSRKIMKSIPKEEEDIVNIVELKAREIADLQSYAWGRTDALSEVREIFKELLR